MSTEDKCATPNCGRSRRWGNAENAKRYCENCTVAVWRTGREPILKGSAA